MKKRRISNNDIGMEDTTFDAMFYAPHHAPTARVVRYHAEGYIQQVVSRSNDEDRYPSIESYFDANPQGVIEFGRTNGCHHQDFRETADLIMVRNRR